MLISGGKQGRDGAPFRVVTERKQAEYARETAVVQAKYKAEVDKAQAEAGRCAARRGDERRPAGVVGGWRWSRWSVRANAHRRRPRRRGRAGSFQRRPPGVD